MAYSQDIRERAIAAVEKEGLSWRAAGRRYRVPPSTVVNWIRAFRQNGRKAPRGMGADRRSVLKAESGWIARLIAREEPDFVGAFGPPAGEAAYIRADAGMRSRFFRAEGFSFKKTVYSAEKGRPDVARRRRLWKGLEPSPNGLVRAAVMAAASIIMVLSSQSKRSNARSKCPLHTSGLPEMRVQEYRTSLWIHRDRHRFVKGAEIP